jgi:site-specific DNA-methyltransferase (adenine-specific)
MSTVTVIQGSCLEVMPKMAAGTVSVVVTSPNYNFGKPYPSCDDARPINKYLADQREAAKQIRRLLTPTGHAFVNVGWNSKHSMRAFEVMLAYAQHLTLQQPIIWTKIVALDGSSLPKDLRAAMHECQVGHFVSLNSKFFLNPTAEIIWHFSPTGRSPIDRQAIGVPYVWADQPARFGHHRELHDRGATWHIPYLTTQSRADRGFHPATFPVALPEYCLKLSGAKPGDLVLDSFMGIGTTLLAAQRLGLDAVGIELDPTYCAAARRRLGQETADAAQ